MDHQDRRTGKLSKNKALEKLSQNYETAKEQYKKTGEEIYLRIMEQYQAEMEGIKQYE